jgi:hypothetical protein
LERFKNCPKQFHDVKVSHEFEDAPNEANKWGNYVHEQCEAYLKAGGTVPLPENMASYQGYLDGILRVPGQMYVEHMAAVDTKLEACDFWDRKNCFMRGKIDVMHIHGNRASLLDHKTGKRKPNSGQMRMMALLVFLLFKEVQRIRVAFAWLKTNEFDAENFTRADIPMLWSTFVPDIKQYQQAFAQDIWQPRQSGLCHGWCPVTSCEYWKPKSIKRK